MTDTLIERLTQAGDGSIHRELLIEARNALVSESCEDSLKRDALISLSATYGANIKHEWERIGRGSLYRDTLEAALSELDPKFSDLCVDAFYNAMKMTVNEAIALVSEGRTRQQRMDAEGITEQDIAETMPPRPEEAR